jgi:HlyD family secretion protein
MTTPVASDPDVALKLGLNAPRRAPIWRRPGFILLLLLVLGAAGAYAWHWREESRKPRYETAAVRRGDLTVRVTATGTLQPVNAVEVGAEISGLVREVKVDFNDRVKAGAPLAEIDTRQLRAQVERSEAALEAAEAALKQADATLLEAQQNNHRTEQLAIAKLVSDQDRDAASAALARAAAAVASARAQVTVSRAQLNSDRTNLEKAVIRSPIDGIVLARKVEPGQTVAATFQTPVLFKLAENLIRMKLIVNVDEADVGVVREGQTASFRVDAYPDREFPATLTSLRNEPQTAQGVVSYEAVLAVDNSGGLLRPGMTATATIQTETHTQVILVPNAAIRFVPPGFTPPLPSEAALAGREPQPSHVWTLAGDKPVAVPVKKGLTDGRSTEITGGAIAPGTQVLVDVATTKPK